MKKLIFILGIFLSTLGLANPIDDKCSMHVLYGAPVSKVPANQGQYICRTGYALHYLYGTKVSEYAVEKVTRKSIAGTAARKDDFREDPAVPESHRATLKDYQGSGYDRGHMAPAADFTYSAEAMSESFFLTNMMPQNPGNNRGIWKYTETYTRSWADAYEEVYVITGTIFDKDVGTLGNGVKVPAHIYKIVIVPLIGKSIAFLFPNEKIPAEDLPKYIVSIADIETHAGIVIMPKLPQVTKLNKTTKAIWKEWAGQ